MKKILVKKGADLTKGEIDQINQANAREFKVGPLPKKYLKTALFFLLVDNKAVLAKGELHPIEPVYFNDEKFSILAIGGVLANKKGKGYGKKVMVAIKNHLISNDKTGVGFCISSNKEFYEKCGFRVDTTSIKKFVFPKGDKKIVNLDDDFVVFKDGPDEFMKKIISHPTQEAIVPRPPDW